MAPQPKPPGARARRNTGQAKWRDVQGLADVPEWPGARNAARAAREYWAVVMAELGGMYGAADRLVLLRASRLHARALAGSCSSAELNALLALEDRLGINPTSRRRLQWELHKAGKGDADTAAPGTDRQRARRPKRGETLLTLVK